MRVSLPRLRCLEDEPKSNGQHAAHLARQHVFAFSAPHYGPRQIGIQFPRHDGWGNELTKCMIVDIARQPADRILERGELLIVTADNLRLVHFIEDSGVFRRV
jgi:hypothetical protein